MLICLDFQTLLSLEVEVPCSFGDWKHLLDHGAEPSAGGAPSVYIISAQTCGMQMQRPLAAMLVLPEAAAFSLTGL